MKNSARISSILKADCLELQATGFPSFKLSQLKLDTELDFTLPNNLRLGHLAERIVSEAIKLSSDHNLLFENIQIIEDKTTVGELDFIIENLKTSQVIHMELAYKFYLFDPSISQLETKNWIGPNRKDSLQEKLEKLKAKQFPLLYHNYTCSVLNTINISDVAQALCMLVSLYIPFEYKEQLSTAFKNMIKGYYLDFETFDDLDNASKLYHIPKKTEWGIPPTENKKWTPFSEIENQIKSSLSEKQALLCWQKEQEACSEFFIVWW